MRTLSEDLDTLTRNPAELGQIDTLTELPNRFGFEKMLAMELKRARSGGLPLSAVIVDCDGLRRINDRFGQAVGDLVIAEVGRRMKQAVRGSDHVGRVGGDEFMALLPNTGLWPGEQVAQRIKLQVGASPLLRSPQTVNLSVSVAAMQLAADSNSAHEVWPRAALELKKRKLVGKSEQEAFARQQPGQAAVAATLEVAEQLLHDQCYRALQQPILDLQQDAVWGYELLTRTGVQHFELPGDFLRVALEHDILTLVDLNCLRCCARTAAAREQPSRYHLNVFPATLLNISAEQVLDILGQPSAGSYCLELSEQQFFGDTRQLKTRLDELRCHGLQIALDDVGFGRTSLELLILLEPDVVKIDRQFVTGIGDSPVRRAALRRLLDIIAACGALAIAEGIETESDLHVTRDLGVSLVQGYALGQPSELARTRHAEHGLPAAWTLPM